MRTPMSFALLLIATGLISNCADAMARKPLPDANVSPVTTETGDRARGYQLGQRNGSLMVSRLRQRTVDAQGCAAVQDLESALVQVTRAIRPPVRSTDAVVGGFYQGYLDAVHTGVHEVRTECEALVYESGEFAGSLLGSVVCQVISVDAQALSTLEATPLYAGWSGGEAEVVASCHASVQATITACAGPEAGTEIELIVRSGCKDQAN
jgi:hypothetical protein